MSFVKNSQSVGFVFLEQCNWSSFEFCEKHQRTSEFVELVLVSGLYDNLLSSRNSRYYKVYLEHF